MRETKTIPVKLDLYHQNRSIYSFIQGNNTILYITLLEDGKPYIIRDGVYPALIGIRSDGRKVPQDTGIAVADNTVTVTLRREFLSVAGNLKMELWLIDVPDESDIDISSGEKPEGYAISTFPFYSVVHESLLEQNIPDAEDAYPLIAIYSGGSEGNWDYEQLNNKPKIEGVELTGNRELEEIGVGTLSNLDIRDIFKI